MKFESIKINEFLRDTDYYLIPDLQRGYVWKQEKVTKLFDSLLFKLPISSLLLWKYETVEDLFTFYKIKSSKDALLEDTKAIPNKSIIVLDGQQRLTSLNILFNAGIWQKEQAFYINLLDDNLTSMKLEINDTDEVSYLKIFKKQPVFSDKDCWVKTEVIWKLAEAKEDFFKLKEELENLEQTYRSEIEKIISKNFNRVKEIFDIEIPTICLKEQNPDNLLEAFTRLNNQGQSLSKADLIFSAAKCKNAEAHAFLKKLSMDYKGESSFLDNRDAIIRLMFAKEISNSQVDLKGLDEVLKAVVLHKKFWEDNLDDFNEFLEKQFTGQFNLKEPAHAACIIAFLYLSHFEFSKESQTKICEFLIRALLFAVWTASIDSVIGTIAEKIKNSKDDEVTLLEQIYQILKSRNKNLDLDERLLGKDKTKDQKVFYHILALQDNRPDQWFETKFEKDLDHIFPKKLLKENNISNIDDYRNKAFLPSRKNKAKNAKHPTKWFEELDDDDKLDCLKYGRLQALDWNYISQIDKEANIPEVYEAFLQHREALIKKRLNFVDD
jgi:uncharacterized protein with ParB-like and HNH nuclease domain